MDPPLTISGLAPPVPELRRSSEAVFGKSGHRHITFSLVVYVLDSTEYRKKLEVKIDSPSKHL